MDGRSMRPLLEGDPGAWPDDRALPIELDDSYAYTAIRTPGYLYSEMTADRDGELPKPAIELYDLDEPTPTSSRTSARSTDDAIADGARRAGPAAGGAAQVLGDRGPGPEGPASLLRMTAR